MSTSDIPLASIPGDWPSVMPGICRNAATQIQLNVAASLSWFRRSLIAVNEITEPVALLLREKRDAVLEKQQSQHRQLVRISLKAIVLPAHDEKPIRITAARVHVR
jgi:hypothetical protein